jgi:MarR family transcriptional regulator, organic hydroperoxide resistance regulator
MRAEEELRFLILGAQREGSRLLTAQLAPLGLTPAQAEVVRVLADAGPISLRGLGELLVCETGSPSRLVDSMVTRGLVERREDAADRRLVSLALTVVGKKLEGEVRKIEDVLYAGIAAGLGAKGVSAALAMLRPLVEGTVSGDAIARRRALPVKRK